MKVKARTALWMILGLAAAVLRPTAAAGAEPASTNRPPGIVLELVDGSRVIGTPEITSLSVQTSYAKVDIPVQRVARVEFKEDRESVNILLRNGDTLTGVLALPQVPLATLFGKASVNVELVRVIHFRHGGELSEVVKQGLVLYYTFDEKGERVEDRSGKGNHGTPRGAAYSPDGLQGGAFQFDGQDDALDCGADPSLQIPGSLTYSLWLKTTQTPPVSGLLVGRRNSNSWDGIASDLELGGDGKVALVVHSGETPVFSHSVGSDVKVNDGRWHHVLGVYVAGESLTLYIDGREAGRNVSSIFRTLNRRPLGVRVGSSQSELFFQGLIDEVMIFNRALSDAEVAEVYNSKR